MKKATDPYVPMDDWVAKIWALAFPDLDCQPDPVLVKAQHKQLTAAQATPGRTDVVLEGWRLFQTDPFSIKDQMGVLYGSRGRRWQTRQLQARCEDSRYNAQLSPELSPEERAELHLSSPSPGCSCGIYAMHNREGLHWNVGDVHASCVFWGWISPGDKGFAAQFCRVNKLYLLDVDGELTRDYSDELRLALSKRYEVECVYENRSRSYVENWMLRGRPPGYWILIKKSRRAK